MNKQHNSSTPSAHEVSPWDRHQVQAYLTEAAWTLSRLPDHERRHVFSGSKSQLARLDMSPDYAPTKTEVRPNAKQIDRYLPVLEWLEWLPDLFDRKLVFCVVASFGGEPIGENERIGWTRLKERHRWTVGRHTLLRHYNAALDLIAGVLTAKGVQDV